jgi:hypothetical protein
LSYTDMMCFFVRVGASALLLFDLVTIGVE